MQTLDNNHRISLAKRSFVTRNVDLQDAVRLAHTGQPEAGDLVLAKVVHIGQHQRIELPSGRRNRLFIGDEILVAYGNRYATDQFEAKVPSALEPCCLVAAGGIAGSFVSRNTAVRMPTRIEPVGLVCREDGSRINLRDYALSHDPILPGNQPKTWVVVGSGMNAGKTTTVANIIRGARQQGARVAALKITGTGAGGDLWHFKDAGAQCALDFTDAGYATTAGISTEEINNISHSLISQVHEQVDLIVIEIADGLFQRETGAVLAHSPLMSAAEKVVFATSDPMAAESGVRMLKSYGITPCAISGAITASQLSSQEAEQATDIKVLDKQGLASGKLHQAQPEVQGLATNEVYCAHTAAAS